MEETEIPKKLYACDSNFNAWYTEKYTQATHECYIMGIKPLGSCSHIKSDITQIGFSSWKCKCGEIMEIGSFRPRR